jgi:hypothetical protein
MHKPELMPQKDMGVDVRNLNFPNTTAHLYVRDWLTYKDALQNARPHQDRASHALRLLQTVNRH